MDLFNHPDVSDNQFFKCYRTGYLKEKYTHIYIYMPEQLKQRLHWTVFHLDFFCSSRFKNAATFGR